EEHQAGGSSTPRQVVPRAATRFVQARRTERMEPTVAVEHEAGLWSRRARKGLGRSRDAPAGPVGGAVQRSAVVSLDAAISVERVQAVERKLVRRVGRDCSR